MILKGIFVCIVIVIYLHVTFQLKTCQDLEVYETDVTNYEEVCNLKQPVVFQYMDEKLNWKLEDYHAYDVHVYDSTYIDVPLPLDKSIQLFKKGKHATFRNSDFIKETVHTCYADSDRILRPPLVSSIEYDTMFGSEEFVTRLQYHTSCRNFFIITHGSVIIKLTCPNKYINTVKQYETQEFYSEMDPWKDPDKKIKFLTVPLSAGRMISIPAYWWYSIKLEKDARISILHYRTMMNTLATLPELLLGFLQRQNTLTKTLPSFTC